MARAPVLLLPVWRIALPAVSEKVDVSVVGHRDGHASLVDCPIPAVVLPARSIPGIRQIAVLGHLHGHTSLVDRSIPIIALPTASVAVRMCILRYLGGTSLG
jgi:hypothetical protein